MLTIVCVWVKGHVPYGPEYVVKLRNMVARHTPRAHEFVCLTDRPKQLPRDIQTRPLLAPAGWFAWWQKLELWNPAYHFCGRMIYLDLDTLVVGDLGELADQPAHLIFAPPGGTFVPKDGRRVVARFNTSCIVWNGGEYASFHRYWLEYRASIVANYWGDQDLLGELAPPGVRAMPAEWFPRISALKMPPWPSDAKVILFKKPKPHQALEQWPWVKDWWK